MTKFHTFHPFLDEDIQKTLLKNNRVLKVFKNKNNVTLVFPLKIPFCKKSFSMLWSNQNHKNLSKIAKKFKAIYTVIEPNTFETCNTTPKEPFKSLVPIQTNLIDLQLSEDEILKQMHQKGRYNIKVAQKHDIKIKLSKEIDIFYDLLKQTSQRDSFSINSKQFIQNFYHELAKNKKAKLLIAYKDKTPIAGLLMTYFKDTAIYYYGASAHEYRKFMAPYLIQWKAIQTAKKDGLKTYDFLGVTTSKNQSHQLYGVSQFKLKLSKNVINFTNRNLISHKPILFTLIRIKKLLQK